MTLDLDARQRAMLAEMGVRLFEPAPPEERPAPVAASASASRPVPAAAQAPAQGHVAAALSAPAHESPDMQAATSPARSPAPSATPSAAPAAAPALQDRASPSQRAPVPAPATPLGERPAGVESMDWDSLEQAVAGCQACGLCQGRRQTVFGVGDRQADWLIVGEAPGEQEDLQGEPFVGPAGKLLDNMLKAIALNRHEQVYIANVLKCRPPGNRNPEPAEVAQCEPFLRRQVALLQPKIILAMGRFAVQSLLGTTEAIGKLRGRVHDYQGVPLIVTYHPAYLLRNLPDKAKAWADLCLALEQLPPKG